MRRQVNFYALEHDHDFIRRLAQDAGLLALPRVVSTQAYDLAHLNAVPPLDFELAEGETYFYLIPDSVAVVEAFYEPMENEPAKSWLKSWLSPVIEFAPSYRLQDRVHHGRLYIDAPRHDPWSQNLYRTYEKLARRIRKWEKVSRSLYVGPFTMQLASNGRVKVLGMRKRKSYPQSKPMRKAALAY